jgi:hypothetical protein
LRPFTLGLHFNAADPRLQFQELQLRFGEFFAAESIFLDPYQTQSRFQHPVLILGELESVLIDRERTVELFEQRAGKGVFELADQRRIKGFSAAKSFGRWLSRHRLGIDDVSETVLQRYIASLKRLEDASGRKGRLPYTGIGLRHLLRGLRESGLIEPQREARTCCNFVVEENSAFSLGKALSTI